MKIHSCIDLHSISMRMCHYMTSLMWKSRFTACVLQFKYRHYQMYWCSPALSICFSFFQKVILWLHIYHKFTIIEEVGETYPVATIMYCLLAYLCCCFHFLHLCLIQCSTILVCRMGNGHSEYCFRTYHIRVGSWEKQNFSIKIVENAGV